MSPSAPTLGARIKHAMQVFGAHQPGKRTDHASFGQAVASVEGVAPYAADTIFAWIADRDVPSYSTMMAIAELGGRKSEAAVAQLLYGDEWQIHGLNERDYRRVYGLE